MKQGSTDDPFAEEPGEDEDDEVKNPMGSETTEPDDAGSTRTLTEESGAREVDAGSREVQRQSLPYIHARDGVKDGRTQRPVFLRDHVENGIDVLVDRMESELEEDVYKTDVTEAAMVVAQEHPELVLEILEEWGYGWD